MIKVERDAVAVPDCLRTDIDSDGKRETEEANLFFAERALARSAARAEHAPGSTTKDSKAKKSFEFKVYKQAKPALNTLFNNKCGYCEIDYGGAASDVEHFRPKGAILSEKSNGTLRYREGYYWLAADWDNLIYSCQHCNRRETHEHQDEPENPLRTAVSGKGNYFPLSDETMRLKPGEAVDREEPVRLLLDPCKDQPNEHLHFHQSGFVTAKVHEGVPSPRGVASIWAYGLGRVALTQKRKDVASQLLFLIERLNNDIEAALEYKTKHHYGVAAQTLKHIDDQYLQRRRPFLGMAQALFGENVNRSRLEEFKVARFAD